MKVSDLIAKLQQLNPDASITELDALRLFVDDSAFQVAQQRIDTVKSFLEAGDMDGLREFINTENIKLGIKL